MQVTGTEIQLVSRPDGLPQTENFAAVERSYGPLAEGQVLVKNRWLSVDPYMRGRMVDRKSYIPPYALNQVMDGGAVGEVIESRHADFPVGTKVSGFQGWREFFVSDGQGLTKLPANGVPEQAFLGVLGMTGLTAYVGLFEIAKLQPGETVFVSAASGAVGSVAVQLAKLHGCKVVGSTGSAEKVDYLRELGADAVINYREEADLTAALKAAAPDGIDVYFENVGGAHLQAALANMKANGRIAVCGMIDLYNDTAPKPGPDNLAQIVMKKLTLQGFIVGDHFHHYEAFAAKIGQWISEGKLHGKETVFEGIEQAVPAFLGLFSGKNIGKMLVKL